jgi:methyl-accepting chemotaxis protein
MSSVGEAKQKIASAAEHSEKINEAITGAVESLSEATRLVTEAAGDVEHELIHDALQKFKEARDTLSEAAKMAKEAQEAANAYADHVG